MNVLTMPSERVEAQIHDQLDRGELKVLQGRLQRVNYQSKEVNVISGGKVWRFSADDGCQFWFDDQKTILRCFHPLDEVRVIYQENQPNVIKALYAWEKQVA